MASYNNYRSARPRPQRAGQWPHSSSNRPAKSGKRGVFIHPSKFVNKEVVTVEQTVYQAGHTFRDFGFQSRLQQNLDNKGFSAPSAIQDQAIQPILDGNDVFGLANTGTGKTAAFLLPLIQKLIRQPVAPNPAYGRLETDIISIKSIRLAGTESKIVCMSIIKVGI